MLRWFVSTPMLPLLLQSQSIHSFFGRFRILLWSFLPSPNWTSSWYFKKYCLPAACPFVWFRCSGMPCRPLSSWQCIYPVCWSLNSEAVSISDSNLSLEDPIFPQPVFLSNLFSDGASLPSASALSASKITPCNFFTKRVLRLCVGDYSTVLCTMHTMKRYTVEDPDRAMKDDFLVHIPAPKLISTPKVWNGSRKQCTTRQKSDFFLLLKVWAPSVSLVSNSSMDGVGKLVSQTVPTFMPCSIIWCREANAHRLTTTRSYTVWLEHWSVC